MCWCIQMITLLFSLVKKLICFITLYSILSYFSLYPHIWFLSLFLSSFYLILFHKRLLFLRISDRIFNTISIRVSRFSHLYGLGLASRQWVFFSRRLVATKWSRLQGWNFPRILYISHLEYETTNISRGVGKRVPNDVDSYPRRKETSNF